MNQARIWLVVKPTVGLPLFLGTVLIMSLLVHYSILANTTWFAAFFEGGHGNVATLPAGDSMLAGRPQQEQ